MAATDLVVAYGGSYYGQIPYGATDVDSLVAAVSFTASYTPIVSKTASYIPIISKTGRAS